MDITNLSALAVEVGVAIEAAVGRAEIEWSFHEDNHRYPRDFWHARIDFCGFSTSWEQYGKQEDRNLPDDVKAAAEAELRDNLRGMLRSALIPVSSAETRRAA